MRKSTLAKEDEATIDMTPMLDVVFIMLIFFIVTSSFIKEAGINVAKPEAEMAERKDLTSMLIAINKANEIWIDRRRIDRDAVKPVITQLYAENPKGTVVVQADRDSNAETVMFVMDAAREAGVNDIAIAALEK
ncbi:MAG TPA: biopolymer transporter ExbD [Gammaproteobacteria bacterium]